VNGRLAICRNSENRGGIKYSYPATTALIDNEIHYLYSEKDVIVVSKKSYINGAYPGKENCIMTYIAIGLAVSAVALAIQITNYKSATGK
jgi:multisubunit Na+/H+ antiporter MnhC subunit